jgi:divalent metal cation (Fe/Co/Zn/Cd) transporter
MTAPQGFRRNKRVVYVAIGVNLGIAATKFIAAFVSNDPAVAAVNRVLTMYIGPSEVLLNLDVQFHSFLSAAQLSATVRRLEQAIRAQHPHIKRIFIEAVAVAASLKAAK